MNENFVQKNKGLSANIKWPIDLYQSMNDTFVNKNNYQSWFLIFCCILYNLTILQNFQSGEYIVICVPIFHRHGIKLLLI